MNEYQFTPEGEERPSEAEEAIAEGMEHLLEQAFMADLGFDRDDPETPDFRADAQLALLARIACEMSVIRNELLDGEAPDNPYNEPWKQ